MTQEKPTDAISTKRSRPTSGWCSARPSPWWEPWEGEHALRHSSWSCRHAVVSQGKCQRAHTKGQSTSSVARTLRGLTQKRQGGSEDRPREEEIKGTGELNAMWEHRLESRNKWEPGRKWWNPKDIRSLIKALSGREHLGLDPCTWLCKMLKLEELGDGLRGTVSSSH